VFVIEAGKGVPNDVFRISAVETLAKQCEEHGEVDGSRGLGDHPLQVVVGRILTWRRREYFNVLCVST